MVGLSSMAMMGLMQLINVTTGRAGSEKAQHLQMEFQAALQARQWEETARLQREMHRLNARASRENARLAFERQKLQFEEQAFLNTWPLQEDPLTLRRDFQKMLDEGRRIPLQVIIPVVGADLNLGRSSLAAGVAQALAGVAQFTGLHYPHQPGNETPVKVYTNCARPNTTFGTSQLHILYEVFHVAPTFVLLPHCTAEKEFVISCAYWDGCDAAKSWTPSLCRDIFRCNIKELQIQALRDHAQEWKRKKLLLQLENDQLDKLLQLVEEEERVVEEKRRLGATDDDIECYIRPSYEAQYAELCKSNPVNIDGKIGEMVRSACKVGVVLMSDMHYLAHEHKAPKFLQICGEELTLFPELLSTAENLFEASLALPGEPFSPTAVLGHARLASSYARSAQYELARKHQQCCVRLLRNMVPQPEGEDWVDIPELPEAVRTLEESSLPVDAYLTACLRELRCSPDLLLERGAAAYHRQEWSRACDLWRRAAQQGSEKACVNLAQMYEHGKGVPRDPEQAACYMEMAFGRGFLPALRKSHVIIAHYLQAGNWVRAGEICLMVLESPMLSDAEKQGAWVISSLLMLTSIADELSGDVRRRWMIQVQSRVAETFRSGEAYSLHVLQELEGKGNLHALDALILLLGKRCTPPAFAGIPFFADVPDTEGVRLMWTLRPTTQMLELLAEYIEKSQRLCTPRSGEWAVALS